MLKKCLLFLKQEKMKDTIYSYCSNNNCNIKLNIDIYCSIIEVSMYSSKALARFSLKLLFSKEKNMLGYC